MKLCFKIAEPMWWLYPLPPKNQIEKALIGFVNTRVAVANHKSLWVPVQDIAGGITAYKELEVIIRKAFNLKEEIALPFQSVICINELPESIWQIAPPGCLLVPAGSFENSPSWIGPWEIVDLKGCYPENDPFPFRSLFLIGNYKRECFFCGSHDHTTENCPNPWGDGFEDDFISFLSKKPPELWRIEVQHMLSSEGTKGKKLSDLKSSLRICFNWSTAIKVCLSTATSLAELRIAPIKQVNQQSLGPVIAAIEKKDLVKAHKILKTFDPDKAGAVYYILMGLIKTSFGNLEEATALWLSAYKNAGIPMHRAYSALLLARAYLLEGELEKAEEAIFKAVDADGSAAPCNYWRVIIYSIRRRSEFIGPGIRRLSSLPRWFTAAIMEPLLIPYIKTVVKEFNSIVSELEERIESELKKTDFLIENFEAALGKDFVESHKIKLRDWRGKRSNMGYADLINAPEYLSSFRQELRKQGYSILKSIISTIKNRKKELEFICSTQIFSPKARRLRLKAMELLNQSQWLLKKLKDFNNLKQLAGIKEKAEALDIQASEVIEDFKETLKTDQRIMLIGKILGRLLLAGGIIWLVYALWDFFRTLFLG